MRAFASDNYAGAHPRILEAIAAANADHAGAYGMDPWTAGLQERVREHFGEEATAFPVFNGTAANVLSVECVTERWEAVVCAASAHLHVDECGAPERAGRKLLVIEPRDAKLTPDRVRPALVRFGDEHAVQPKVVSITQSTELGTVYAPDEVAALAALAHEHGMLLHVDGARLFNAAASLGLPLRALTTDAGVDLLSLGATKNGALGAEAVVLLRADLAPGLRFLRKQAMQLASKMRFLSAQLEAMLAGGLWHENAAHANAMARRLEQAVAQVPGVRISRPVQANAVFAVLPREAVEPVQRRFPFYVWDEAGGEVRWMCSWDTTPEDVDAFAAAIADAVSVATG